MDTLIFDGGKIQYEVVKETDNGTKIKGYLIDEHGNEYILDNDSKIYNSQGWIVYDLLIKIPNEDYRGTVCLKKQNPFFDWGDKRSDTILVEEWDLD